jgi:hypothetical protein
MSNIKILVLNNEEAEMLRDEIVQQWEVHQANIDNHNKVNDLTEEELESFQAFANMYKRLYKELLYQGVRPLLNHPLTKEI